MTTISGYIVVNVTGLSSPGTVSAPGLKAGDRVIQATSTSLNGNVNIFEAVVSVDDQLQQFEAFGSNRGQLRYPRIAPLITCLLRKGGRRLLLGRSQVGQSRTRRRPAHHSIASPHP